MRKNNRAPAVSLRHLSPPVSLVESVPKRTESNTNKKIVGQIKVDDVDADNRQESAQTTGGEGGGEGDDDGPSQNMLQPNKKISKSDFIFCKVIGRGSFGKVYLVKKKDKSQMPLALKILQKDVVAKRNLLIKTQGKALEPFITFVAERDILEKIDSPFIVKLHYAFQTDAKLYFVMDFCNGGELFTHLRKETKFSERRACFYAAQLVEALSCLHKNGIIYRDLKPENVLLDGNGNLKITDFGLSKQGVDTEDEDSKTYSFCGTPEYLAPEII